MNTIKPSTAWRTLIALTTLTLAACGSSGTGSTTGTTADSTACIPGNAATASACGGLAVALTDAEGDFASYTVDVLSISLQRTDGAVVELLPEAARIDFAQLTSLSELLSMNTVVPGEFVSGRIRLDYNNAEIYVEANGDIVPARVFDGDGTELTTDSGASVVEVDISLPANGRVRVTRGAVAFLSIDFDLRAFPCPIRSAWRSASSFGSSA
jgi:hypothetical protein